MADIVITEFMDDAAVDLMKDRYATHYDPTLVDRPDDLPSAIGAARALIVRNRTKVTTALLGAAPQLECVGRLGVGLDNIDLNGCAARDVAVFPASGANDVAVAEYVIATALLLLRGAFASTGAMIAGQWPRQTLIGREAQGKRLGLVGFGSIARQTAARARALGFSICAFDPLLPTGDPAWQDVERLDLDALLGRADVISLHVPLNDQTRRMIDEAALGKMRAEVILINSSRGGVVDEAALAVALRAGKLAGAALDVFEDEPLGAESGKRFAGIANLVLTPHIAGVTEESNVRVSRVTAENVLRHLERTP